MQTVKGSHQFQLVGESPKKQRSEARDQRIERNNSNLDVEIDALSIR
jgi:hypothetical protein